MSSRRPDPPRAGHDEQDHQPYQGKHRAPESKSRGLGRSVATMVLDQSAAAPHPVPDTPASDSAEDRVDQQASSGQQSENGSGESSQGVAERPD